MKEEKEFFEIVKNDSSLSPDEDFVTSTEVKLRKMARNYNRKRKFQHIPVVATTLALFLMAISWLFLLGGTQTINMASSNSGQSNQLPLLSPEEPLVYIYHSHNRESFKHELNVEDARKAYDESINITLVGQRIADTLKRDSVVAVHDKTDFYEIMMKKGIPDTYAYLESREAVKVALKDHQHLKMVIDVHRDTVNRNESTIEINGEEYARIAFIVSERNDTNSDNLELAEAVHKELNQKFPELSRGIILKESEQRSANYNQDLFNKSILISIGGVENTLDEEYRTADILAEVIKKIIQK